MVMIKRTAGKSRDAESVARFLDFTVLDVTGRGKIGELYGLELELEGRNIQMEGRAVRGFTQVADGSLRGESTEYTFSNPCNFEDACRRVDSLFQKFMENDVRIKNSYRCSTHAHVNFGDKKIKYLVNFFVLFTVIEELLEEYCGEGRNGNVFALPNRDVEPILDMLDDAIMKTFNLGNFGNNIRYCACNLSALNKFGSVEIRTMRGAENAEMIKDWLQIIHEMYDFALNKMRSPVWMIENMSLLGVRGFLESVFSVESLAKLMSTWPIEKDLDASFYTGVRLIQLFAYRWEEAYNIEVPEIVKRAPKKQKKRLHYQQDRIISPDGVRSWGIPAEYEEGTKVRHIQPQEIIYDPESDAWYEITDARGQAIRPFRRWLWMEEHYARNGNLQKVPPGFHAQALEFIRGHEGDEDDE